MCNCGFVFVYTDYSTKICTSCGLEKQIPYTNTDFFFQSGGPLTVCYSRLKRFETMLNSVCYPRQNHPKLRIIKVLQTKQHQSSESVLDHLKAIKQSNKHYSHLHLYCMITQKNYVKPAYVAKTIILDILRKFTEIEQRFNTLKLTSTFFSYTWLLRKLLSDFQLSPYVKFVKKIKCPKRNDTYQQLYTQMFSPEIQVVECRQVLEAL